MSILERLTEGVVNRNVAKEGAALLNKWSKTGLLEGLTGDHERQSMAVLLENQAKELLREANVQGGNPGAVQGFAAVAFPLVRRVFGGLLANDLVSVQPMSLPSGLIFFLDFTKTDDRDGTQGDSVHGQGVVGSEIIDGVTLGEDGFYNLSQGYSLARGSCATGGGGAAITATGFTLDDLLAAGGEALAQDIDFDADLLADAHAGSTDAIAIVTFTCGSASVSSATTAVRNGENDIAQMTPHHVMALSLDRNAAAYGSGEALENLQLIRRLTKCTELNTNGTVKTIQMVMRGVAHGTVAGQALDLTFPIGDNISEVSGGLGALNTKAVWELESTLASPFENDGMNIPEIDIKVDSSAITAVTRKMKAKWTPELGQDLNAYHNLDAEVELTQVLSEQIALEIDQEILKDLITQAKAGTQYWSRVPGRFLNKAAGTAVSDGDFTGTVSEWYETLVETINDVSAQIHRKTLRGGANFLVCGPEVANILEFTNGFRASVTHDDDKGTVGAVKEGSINKKFDLYVDPYFPRNVILVGRKGSSFLESGYVYAPYVPLQTTPTIFGPEDFTPRKGVMTRYGKKMVRPDMYGLVIVRDLLDSPTV